jgi:adenylate cyclase
MISQKFRHQIRSGEYVFTFASDGMQALEQLEQDETIHIILTDINMPRMDGLTLLARLDKLERLLKAVVVTAYGDMKNIRIAMNRGAFDFLTKPIDLNDLEITVQKARTTVEQQIKAAHVRETFGRYLTDEVVSILLDQPEAPELGGEKRVVTLLMSDLRGFSTFSEYLPPEKVVEVLNIYLGTMADAITAHQGTINEFIGDAIFVIFGAPIQRDDDAARAVACALEMQCAMDAVNEEMRARHLPMLEMGIGINTGEVVVGNIGAPTRMKYGVVGSQVNLTSRIESYTVGGQILISESTLVQLGPLVQIGKEMQVSTKGFSDPINIYEVQAIGAPYNIALPSREEAFVALETALYFRYTLLDGQHMTHDVFTGVIVSLAPSGAIIRVDEPLDLLSNLKIMLPSSQTPQEIVGDLYAKVVSHGGAENHYTIRFTAVPERVAEALRALT